MSQVIVFLVVTMKISPKIYFCFVATVLNSAPEIIFAAYWRELVKNIQDSHSNNLIWPHRPFFHLGKKLISQTLYIFSTK